MPKSLLHGVSTRGWSQPIKASWERWSVIKNCHLTPQIDGLLVMQICSLKSDHGSLYSLVCSGPFIQ